MAGNESQIQSQWKPSQHFAKMENTYETTMKTASLNVVKWIATHYLPELSCDALKRDPMIHDNGCGCGTATEAILTTSSFPPPKYQFECTDIDRHALQILAEEAEASKYPASIRQMNSDSLDFPDNHFDISFTHLVVPYLRGDPENVARHLYRTLKPGGRAVATTWAYLPHHGPVSTVAIQTRRESVPFTAVAAKWSPLPLVIDFFRHGGFNPEKCAHTNYDVTISIESGLLRHWVSGLWSSVGMRAGGWIKEDEDNWDQTIDTIVRELKRAKGVTYHSGKYHLRLYANIVVAQKED